MGSVIAHNFGIDIVIDRNSTHAFLNLCYDLDYIYFLDLTD